MSFITAKSFIFNGINSTDFNLIIGWTDNTVDVSGNGLIREITKSENNRKLKSNIYGTSKPDNITFEFSIFDVNGEDIPRTKSIQINRWLTSPSLPQKLNFNDCDSYDLNYYAVCTQIDDIIAGGRLIGKSLKFETSSPFAFSKKNQKAFHIEGEGNFYFNNTADTYDGLFYPVIIITAPSTASDIIIENITDKRSVTVNMKNVPDNSDGNKIVRIDCENMIITDYSNDILAVDAVGWNEEYQSYVSATDSYIEYIYWVRLLSGMNQFKITGSCTFLMEYEFPRKAGCL